jgi:hypothetical protein
MAIDKLDVVVVVAVVIASVRLVGVVAVLALWVPVEYGSGKAETTEPFPNRPTTTIMFIIIKKRPGNRARQGGTLRLDEESFILIAFCVVVFRKYEAAWISFGEKRYWEPSLRLTQLVFVIDLTKTS